MKYVSIDVETTGIDPSIHQIVEIGAVIEDTTKNVPVEQLPTFHCYVTHEQYVVSEYVLGMHSDSGIWQKLRRRPNGYQFVQAQHVAEHFADWLFEHYFEDKDNPRWPLNINAAGKNFGSFDIRFLQELRQWKESIRVRRRILDPAILYAVSDDEHLPNLDECIRRAGLDNNEIKVTHNAVDDARAVVHVIRAIGFKE